MTKPSQSIRILFAVLVAAFVMTPQWNAAVAKDAPKPTFISDLVGQLDRVKEQVVSLEASVPQEKFNWRPMEGVRSISEVYLHIADANYLLANFAGLQSPFDNKILMDEKARDTRTTDKAKIAEALNESFAWTTSAVSKLTEADLEKMVDFFGSKMTVRSMLMSLLSHIHEHLGQSIAYARSNGVVPPWTAKMQEAMKQKDSQKK